MLGLQSESAAENQTAGQLCATERGLTSHSPHFVCYFAPAIVSEVFIWYHSLFVTFMFVLS